MARTQRSRPRGGEGRRYGATKWAALAGAAALGVLGPTGTAGATAPQAHGAGGSTATPVKHLVVLFDENISFDHYFGTYPKAANTDGTSFHPSKDTPEDVENLRTAGLLKHNPNQYKPKRLTPDQAVTCDQKHDYSPEQYADNGGKADKYVEYTDSGKCSGGLFGEPGLAMDYFDGNTVTGMWNYAQHYALSDNSRGSTYGPSTPGAINLVSGQTHGLVSTDPDSSTEHPEQADKPDKSVNGSPDKHGVGTMYADPDPAYDDCSGTDHTGKDDLSLLKGKNIGDRLNQRKVSWGWFQGGFKPGKAWNGKKGDYAKCAGVTHANVGGEAVEDYSPHHNPFAYYKSTANPHHLRPRSQSEIGHDGRANHNYDLTDFNKVAKAGSLPSVSFLKAPSYRDGHAGYSDPTDEQHFLVDEINQIQKSPQWKDTAVVVAYDDSDGWYDHVAPKLHNGSKDKTKNDDGDPMDAKACRKGPSAAGGYKDRCGPGPRLPLLVISPYSKVNHIDHTATEQTSIIKFIENNWHTRQIGDHSFDARAGSLKPMFDFQHPNNKQVLLKKNGDVAKAGAIPPASNNPSVDGGSHPIGSQAQDRLAETGSSLTLPVGAGIGALAVAGAAGGFLLARRRKQQRTNG